jgi:hypothetical protein
MKSFALAFIFISFSFHAQAQDLEETFKKIGVNVCDKIIAEKGKLKESKSLKLKGTLLESVCSLTPRPALTNCSTDTAKIYKNSLSSTEKDKVSKVLKSGLAFCADYSELVSVEIVNVIIKKAELEKISIDEASKKILVDAAKMNESAKSQ